jgi:hypothetical protein
VGYEYMTRPQLAACCRAAEPLGYDAAQAPGGGRLRRRAPSRRWRPLPAAELFRRHVIDRVDAGRLPAVAD